ncbi:MAG: low molecular weight phosphatase family protein [Alphaproteobacteria bacterium]|nr:low molecular weight phosphatase family protein [Alphaproteobacteria bacterium]
MASALLRHYLGRFLYVTSAGVRPGDLDPMAVEVMNEWGIDMHGHHPRSFEELDDSSFDLIVSLSPEAQHKAVELTRTMAADVEFWPTLDATAIEGSREQRLDAYRAVRDQLAARIKKRFMSQPPP